LARRSKIEFKSLKDVALVSLPIGSGTRRLIDGAAAAAGFTLRHAVTVGLPITVFNPVRRGTGAAIVPAHTLPRWARDDLVARRLVGPSLSSEIGIIRLRERALSPAAQGLLALARQHLGKA